MKRSKKFTQELSPATIKMISLVEEEPNQGI